MEVAKVIVCAASPAPVVPLSFCEPTPSLELAMKTQQQVVLVHRARNDLSTAANLSGGLPAGPRLGFVSQGQKPCSRSLACCHTTERLCLGGAGCRGPSPPGPLTRPRLFFSVARARDTELHGRARKSREAIVFSHYG